MKRRSFLRLGTGVAASAALSACGDGHGGHAAADDKRGGASGGGPAPSVPSTPSVPGQVVSGWTQTALQAVRSARPGPPMAARSLAIMYTCMYDAWCAYDPVALPALPGQAARRPPAEHTSANKAMAMSYAAHAALVDQFPSEKAGFDEHMRQLGYDPAGVPAERSGPSGLGAMAARTEVAWCHTDGANQLGTLAPGGVPYADYTGYVPRNPPLVVGQATPRDAIPEPGLWQPLTYVDGGGTLRTPAFLAPAWPLVRPFALASGAQYRPGPPAACGSGDYRDEVMRIVELQATLTDEQKVIAEYWADNPGTDLPPGHWLSLALIVSARDRHSDDDDIRMLFALSNALADAAIAAWDAKRAYDSVRPLTAVRYLLNGQTITGYGLLGPAGGLGSIAGETWMPYQLPTFPTPPFPEYVSGHSTFSGAAAEVLRRFTGSDAFGAGVVRAAHSLAVQPGLPSADVRLDWPTFTAAAEQAGISRVYGGIHFDHGNTAGMQLGRRVGALVSAKAERLWQGGT
jgi:hypothetical protein